MWISYQCQGISWRRKMRPLIPLPREVTQEGSLLTCMTGKWGIYTTLQAILAPHSCAFPTVHHQCEQWHSPAKVGGGTLRSRRTSSVGCSSKPSTRLSQERSMLPAKTCVMAPAALNSRQPSKIGLGDCYKGTCNGLNSCRHCIYKLIPLCAQKLRLHSSQIFRSSWGNMWAAF